MKEKGDRAKTIYTNFVRSSVLKPDGRVLNSAIFKPEGGSEIR